MGRLLFRNSWPMCGPDGSTSSSSKGPSREAGRAGVARFPFNPQLHRSVGGLLSGDHIIFFTEHGDNPMLVHAMKGARLSSLRSPPVIRIRTSSTAFSSASLVIGFGARMKKL
jgi:hypothetical protein